MGRLTKRMGQAVPRICILAAEPVYLEDTVPAASRERLRYYWHFSPGNCWYMHSFCFIETGVLRVRELRTPLRRPTLPVE